MSNLSKKMYLWNICSNTCVFRSFVRCNFRINQGINYFFVFILKSTNDNDINILKTIMLWILSLKFMIMLYQKISKQNISLSLHIFFQLRRTDNILTRINIVDIVWLIKLCFILLIYFKYHCSNSTKLSNLMY